MQQVDEDGVTESKETTGEEGEVPVNDEEACPDDEDQPPFLDDCQDREHTLILDEGRKVEHYRLMVCVQVL